MKFKEGDLIKIKQHPYAGKRFWGKRGNVLRTVRFGKHKYVYVRLNIHKDDKAFNSNCIEKIDRNHPITDIFK